MFRKRSEGAFRAEWRLMRVPREEGVEEEGEPVALPLMKEREASAAAAALCHWVSRGISLVIPVVQASEWRKRPQKGAALPVPLPLYNCLR